MSRPLLDRLEVINMSGYSEEEKMFILNNYLLKNTIEKSGLTKRKGQFNITEEAKKQMIK